MNRAEFIQRLTDLLGDVPQTERESAIQYYNDYFDDAGAENEADVIASLGTPEELAKAIKAGLADGGGAGEFTEAGFQGYDGQHKNEVIDSASTQRTSNGNDDRANTSDSTQKKKLSGGVIALIVIAVILTFPVWIGIAGGLFGIAVGIIAVIFSILVTVLAVGLSCAVAGLLVFCAGVVSLFMAPLSGMCMVGAGMVVFAVGLVFIWLLVMLAGTTLPWLIRESVKLCRRIFHRGGAQA